MMIVPSMPPEQVGVPKKTLGFVSPADSTTPTSAVLKQQNIPTSRTNTENQPHNPPTVRFINDPMLKKTLPYNNPVNFRQAAPPPKTNRTVKQRGAGKPSLSRAALENRGMSPDTRSYFGMTAKDRKQVSLSACDDIPTAESVNTAALKPNLSYSASQPSTQIPIELQDSPFVKYNDDSKAYIPKEVASNKTRLKGSNLRKDIEEYKCTPQGMQRRRQEKNYSDFFQGPKNNFSKKELERKEPSSVTVTNQLRSWMDPRTEICRRRQEAKVTRNFSPERRTASPSIGSPGGSLHANRIINEAFQNNTDIEYRDAYGGGFVHRPQTARNAPVSHIDTGIPTPSDGNTQGAPTETTMHGSPRLRAACASSSSFLAHSRYTNEMRSHDNITKRRNQPEPQDKDNFNISNDSACGNQNYDAFIKKASRPRKFHVCNGIFTNRNPGQAVFFEDFGPRSKQDRHAQSAHNLSSNEIIHWSGAQTARGKAPASNSLWDQARHRKLSGLQSDPSALFGGYTR